MRKYFRYHMPTLAESLVTKTEVTCLADMVRKIRERTPEYRNIHIVNGTTRNSHLPASWGDKSYIVTGECISGVRKVIGWCNFYEEADNGGVAKTDTGEQ